MARKIEVEIVGDASSLKRALNEAEGHTGRLGGAMGTLAKATAAAGLAIGAGLAVGAKKAVDAASNLGESINAVNVSFGKAAPEVLKFTQSAAKFGLSARAANEAMVPLGAGLQNLGFSAKEAAGSSIALTKRAADLASVFNTDLDSALTAIQAGLRGEADPLEKFGIGLSSAAVNAHAMSLGLAESEKALTAQDKAQARVSLLMEQSNKVAGDFANTSDGLANSQRILRAEVENAGAAIGGALLPVAAKVASTLADALPHVLQFAQSLIDRLRPAVTAIGAVVQAHMPQIRSLFASVAEFISTNVVPIVMRLKDIFTEAVQRIAAVVQANMPQIRQIMENVGVVIRNLAAVVIPLLDFAFTTVLPAALRVAIPVIQLVTGAIAAITTAGRNLVQWIGEKAGPAMDTLANGFDAAKKAAQPLITVLKSIRDVLGKIAEIAGFAGGAAGSVIDFIKGKTGDTPWGVEDADISRRFGISPRSDISSNLWDEIAGAQAMGLVLSSGYRPGAYTSTGRPSKHGVFPSKAIDVAGPPAAMRQFALWAAGRSGNEVFYDPLGGKFRIGGHSDHVHVETFGVGGIVSHDGGGGGSSGWGKAVPIIAHQGEGVFTPGQMKALANTSMLGESLRTALTAWEGTVLLTAIRDNTAKLVELAGRTAEFGATALNQEKETEVTMQLGKSMLAGAAAWLSRPDIDLSAAGLGFSFTGAPPLTSRATAGGSVIADPDARTIVFNNYAPINSQQQLDDMVRAAAARVTSRGGLGIA